MGVQVHSARVIIDLRDMVFSDEDDPDVVRDRIYDDVSGAIRNGCSAWQQADTNVSVEDFNASSTDKVARIKLSAFVVVKVRHQDDGDLNDWGESNIEAILQDKAWDDYTVTVEDDDTGDDPEEADYDVDDSIETPAQGLQRSLGNLRNSYESLKEDGALTAEVVRRIGRLVETYGANTNGLAIRGILDANAAHEMALQEDAILTRGLHSDTPYMDPDPVS